MVRCDWCGEEITVADEQADEVLYIDGKTVHADCYYSKLGEEVEEHPISRPRIRRG
jgi:hypothetical protein